MNLTKEEKKFLFELLDQINVSGVEAKTKVLVLMGKLSEEETVPAPSTDMDASE